VVLVITLVTLVPSVAIAGTPTNHTISGYNFFGSCMNSKYCVAGGYNSKGVGDVVAIHNGSQSHVSTLPGSQRLDAVSCPTSSACVGVASFGGSDIGIISINATGVVTGTKKITLTAGYDLTRIACVSATQCELSGVDVFASPEQIVVATWNGKTLVSHKVAVPSKGTDPDIEAVSCWTTTCVVVGSAYVHTSTVLGVSLSIVNGTSIKSHTVVNHSLYGVSCISTSRCYAAGYDEHGGVIDTLTNGSLTSSTATPGSDLMSIACVSTTCTAVGEELATGITNDTYWGTIYPFTSGHLGTVDVDDPVDGFTSVAASGGSFAAFGPTQRGNDGIVALM
jgi:hypothetical protein